MGGAEARAVAQAGVIRQIKVKYGMMDGVFKRVFERRDHGSLEH